MRHVRDVQGAHIIYARDRPEAASEMPDSTTALIYCQRRYCASLRNCVYVCEHITEVLMCTCNSR